MTSRLEWLDQKHHEINQRMNEWKAAPLVIPSEWQSLVDEYEVVARERTWLYEVFSHIPMRRESDTYEQQADRISLRLMFAPVTIVTPFNQFVYAEPDPRASTMSVINIERYGCQYTYSLHVVDKVNPLQVADELVRNYIRAEPKLDELTQGIHYANLALKYIQQHALLGVPILDNDMRLYDLANLARRFPVRNERYGHFASDAYWIIQAEIEKDTMLKRMSESAGKYWNMACKVMAYALLDNKFEVDWKPFGNLG